MKRAFSMLFLLLPMVIVCAQSQVDIWIGQAMKGDVSAMLNLGRAYYDGKDSVSQDPSLASQWFKAAAEAGDEGAQLTYALFLDDGFGVAQNHEEAMHWYFKAAEAGNALAQYVMGVEATSREDYANSISWYQKSADQGFDKAQYNLALCYYYGDGIPTDLKMAADLFQAAAAKDHIKAKYYLGLCYYLGTGVNEDKEKGLQLIQQCARKDYPRAQEFLKEKSLSW